MLPLQRGQSRRAQGAAAACGRAGDRCSQGDGPASLQGERDKGSVWGCAAGEIRTGPLRIRPAVHGEAEVLPRACKGRRGGYTLRAALIVVLLSAPGTQGPGRPALRGAPSILHLLRVPEYSSYRPLHGGSGVILRNGIVLWRSFPARPRTAQGVSQLMGQRHPGPLRPMKSAGRRKFKTRNGIRGVRTGPRT